MVIFKSSNRSERTKIARSIILAVADPCVQTWIYAFVNCCLTVAIVVVEMMVVVVLVETVVVLMI
jgi:hypothetical protein